METGDIILRILNPLEKFLYNPGYRSIQPIFTDPMTLSTELFLVRTFRGLFLVDLGSETDTTYCHSKKKQKKHSLIH